jgi:hypothetical protein
MTAGCSSGLWSRFLISIGEAYVRQWTVVKRADDNDDNMVCYDMIGNNGLRIKTIP